VANSEDIAAPRCISSRTRLFRRQHFFNSSVPCYPPASAAGNFSATLPYAATFDSAPVLGGFGPGSSPSGPGDTESEQHRRPPRGQRRLPKNRLGQRYSRHLSPYERRGGHWLAAQIPDAAALDFRAVVAFSATEAFLMSAGPAHSPASTTPPTPASTGRSSLPTKKPGGSSTRWFSGTPTHGSC